MLRRERQARGIVRAGIAVAFTSVALIAACGGARPQGELEPRYIAVHNTLVAMGLAETGPIQQASLAEGREAKIKLDLAAGCTTVLVLGGSGVKDVHAEVIDVQGNSVAKDTGNGPEAAVRACVAAAGPHALVVRMARGGGDFLTATWSGGAAATNPNVQIATVAPRENVLPQGTCEAPTPLTAGATMGNTSRGESNNQGDCGGGSGDSKEIVYKMDLTARERVILEVEPRGQYDSILYVRQGDCADQGSQIMCNDDVKNAQSRGNAGHPPSRLDLVLEAGTYFVFVDGYGSSEGAYKLSAEVSDVPSLADTCSRARPLTTVQASGTTQGSFDHGNAQCGDEAKGSDTIYKLDVSQRERVRLTEHSDEFPPVVHLRSACADDRTEIGCSDSSVESNDASYVGTLDPGSYAVFADANGSEADGRYTLDLETSPESGTGTQGDACADAVLLPTTNRIIEGDTFSARDDVSGRCTAQGAADVVYRIELPRRLRVSATFAAEEGDHVMSLQKACGDKTTELACANELDETLSAGTYFLSVDGKERTDFGKFKLDWQVRDVALQEAACRSVATLAAGQTVTGNTKNASNKFSTSCGGGDAVSSPDTVYKVVIPSREHVRFQLTTPQHDGVLSIRRACVDPSHTRGQNHGDLDCNMRGDDTHHTRIDRTLEAGTYYVIVDGHGQGQSGPFTLNYTVVK
jgi:hypothetical protein